MNDLAMNIGDDQCGKCGHNLMAHSIREEFFYGTSRSVVSPDRKFGPCSEMPMDDRQCDCECFEKRQNSAKS